MKSLAMGLLSAAAVVTTILLVRQQREAELSRLRPAPGGPEPKPISLDRIRELGL